MIRQSQPGITEAKSNETSCFRSLSQGQMVCECSVTIPREKYCSQESVLSRKRQIHPMVVHRCIFWLRNWRSVASSCYRARSK